MKAVVDRIVQYANRYQLTDVATGEVLGTFDFDEVTGTVQQVGTEIDKELFDSIAADLAARVKLSGGELAGTIVTFSDISGTAANVASGDTSATLWGKVKNWFSRLKSLAFKNKVAAGDFETGAIKDADVAADAAIAQSKVNGLESALATKANDADLAEIAKTGNLSDAIQDETHRLVADTEKATWNAKQSAITGAASTIVSSDLTSARALVSDSSGKVGTSDVTATELGYLDGVTSNIQDQLDNISGGTGFVSTSPQTLTSEQQEQARNNISAASESSVDDINNKLNENDSEFTIVKSDKYTSRQTADGTEIIDGSLTRVQSIQGDTVATSEGLKNAFFSEITSTPPAGSSSPTDTLSVSTPIELTKYDTAYPAENKVVRGGATLTQETPFTAEQLAQYTEYVLSQDGMTIVYKLSEPTEETVVFNKFFYRAYSGGIEFITQGATDNSEYGAECTVTQIYIKGDSYKVQANDFETKNRIEYLNNSIYSIDFNLKNKVDKLPAAENARLYTADKNGNVLGTKISENAENATVPVRNKNGNIIVNSPTAQNEAANKQYIDDTIIKFFDGVAAVDLFPNKEVKEGYNVNNVGSWDPDPNFNSTANVIPVVPGKRYYFLDQNNNPFSIVKICGKSSESTTEINGTFYDIYPNVTDGYIIPAEYSTTVCILISVDATSSQSLSNLYVYEEEDYGDNGTNPALKENVKVPYLAKSILYGKKMMTLGDSLSNTGAWQKIVVENLGMAGFTNLAFGGQKVSHFAENVTEDSLADIDLVFVMGLFNSTESRPGTVEDEASDADNASICAGYKYIVEKVLQLKPSVRIVLASPHRPRANDVSEKAKAVGAVAAYYGIQFIDLYNTAGFNDLTYNTYLADGIHSSQLGYEKEAEVITENLFNGSSQKSDRLYKHDILLRNSSSTSTDEAMTVLNIEVLSEKEVEFTANDLFDFLNDYYDNNQEKTSALEKSYPVSGFSKVKIHSAGRTYTALAYPIGLYVHNASPSSYKTFNIQAVVVGFDRNLNVPSDTNVSTIHEFSIGFVSNAFVTDRVTEIL